jgi:SdrD B-like protein
VQLLDADGNVVATMVSTGSGRYSFSGLDLGTYEVNVLTPAGWGQSTRDLKPFQISRGMNVSGLYGYARLNSVRSAIIFSFRRKARTIARN